MVHISAVVRAIIFRTTLEKHSRIAGGECFVASVLTIINNCSNAISVFYYIYLFICSNIILFFILIFLPSILRSYSVSGRIVSTLPTPRASSIFSSNQVAENGYSVFTPTISYCGTRVYLSLSLAAQYLLTSFSFLELT